MNQDNRNLIVFLVLSVALLLGWQLVAAKLGLSNPPPNKVIAGKSHPVATTGGSPASEAPPAVRDRTQVLAESPRIRIQTPALSGSINLKGARIDDLVLRGYKETIAKNSPPIRLFSPSGTTDAYFAGFGWSGDGIAVPGKDTVFAASAPVLTPQQPVTLSWKSPTGQLFQVRVAVDDSFLFTVQQSVGNASAKPVAIKPYALVSRTMVSKDPSAWNNHLGPIGVFDNGANYDISYENLAGKPTGFFGRMFGNGAQAGDNYFDTTGGWLGFGDKYWLAALVPNQTSAVHSGFRGGNGVYQADYTTAEVTLPPAKMLTTTTRLFAGAKEVNTIDHYESTLGIRLFGKAIDWGWFEIIEKPIFKYLDWLFRMIGNFGVAIILLTLTIRALLFPIAQRQFASMANMRAIQPKMKALQEKYKDDKVRQQQEIMALYKAEKVNPVAGCLPMFLQVPIMFALYKVLILTTEMRHQPFALWIKDLSAPDPATILNLFGFLHFTPPSFLAIGVVPVLLGISMFFQFKLNPAPMDDAQKQVFAIMPWFLMFIMAPFAVGLQLYWITSNCLTILQQRLLYNRHPALKTAATK